MYAVNPVTSLLASETVPGQTSSSQMNPATQQGQQAFASTLAQTISEQMALQLIRASKDPSIIQPDTSSIQADQYSQIEIGLLSNLLPEQAPQSVTGLQALTGVTNLPTLANVSSVGKEAVWQAKQFIGTPYVWGGTSPKGFDCSGFTQYVYGKLGIKLPRTSQEQAQVGQAVGNISQARPGDLVFFAGADGTASAPGHVGIYLGNGQMIDAPYTGTNVRIEPVSDAGPIVGIRNVSGLQTGGETAVGNVMVPTKYLNIIENASQANGVPTQVLAALINQESGFNPAAVSPAGAEGIAQIMPSTAKAHGIDPFNPVDAINGAARILGDNLRHFGSVPMALAAYNAGVGAVSEYGGIPPYAETQNYVSSILRQAGMGG